MELTRGDSAPLKFQRKDANGDPILIAPAQMYFTVKKDWNQTDYVFQKTLADMTMSEDGYWHFVIEPSDTAVLPIGNYVFDIEVTVEGNVHTIAKGTLKLTAEATWVQNK
jgi:hypothetical protein